jgi:hypothetical protein
MSSVFRVFFVARSTSKAHQLVAEHPNTEDWDGRRLRRDNPCNNMHIAHRRFGFSEQPL